MQTTLGVTASSPGYLIDPRLWVPSSCGGCCLLLSCVQLFMLGQGFRGWDPVLSSVSPTYLHTKVLQRHVSLARLNNPPGSTSSCLKPSCSSTQHCGGGLGWTGRCDCTLHHFYCDDSPVTKTVSSYPRGVSILGTI